MSERVTIWRGTVAEDDDGNRVAGPLAPVGTFDALVADEHYSDPVEAGRAAVLVGCRLYIRDQGPTGALPTDLVEVRGEKIPIDGKPGVWYRQNGEHRGDMITLKTGGP